MFKLRPFPQRRVDSVHNSYGTEQLLVVSHSMPLQRCRGLFSSQRSGSIEGGTVGTVARKAGNASVLFRSSRSLEPFGRTPAIVLCHYYVSM